jgi:hypothetical protein
MRLYALVIVSLGLLFVSGCGSNNTGKIEGKWTSEATTLKGQAIPAGLLQLEFRKDGTMTYQTGPLSHTGTYSLGSGDTVTFHFKEALEGQKDHQEKVTISGDKLTMTDSDGTQLTFKKVK